MDAIGKTGLKIAWAVTAGVVLAFGRGLTDWRDIASEIAAGNAADLVAFTAGYTLPLTVGIAISFTLYLHKVRTADPTPGLVLIGAIGGILVVSGLLARWLGLGLAPVFNPINAPFYIALPLMALTGYFFTYGWPLMVCSAAIGISAALQIDFWRSKPDAIVEDLVG